MTTSTRVAEKRKREMRLGSAIDKSGVARAVATTQREWKEMHHTMIATGQWGDKEEEEEEGSKAETALASDGERAASAADSRGPRSAVSGSRGKWTTQTTKW